MEAEICGYFYYAFVLHMIAYKACIEMEWSGLEFIFACIVDIVSNIYVYA